MSDDEKRALKKWCRERYPALVPKLRELVDACLDWHRAKGNLMADWSATCRTWIRNQAQWAGERPRYREAERGSRERPQEVRPHEKRRPEALADLLSMAPKGEA